MTARKKLRGLLAGVSTLALAAVGLIGTAAHAVDNPGVGNINPDAPTSLTIHKSSANPTVPGDGTELTGDDVPTGPLRGVSFLIQQVTYNGTPIDLTTAEGWNIAEGATAEKVASGADGYGIGASNNVSTGPDGTAEIDPGFGLFLVTETDTGDHPIVSKAVPFLVSVPYPSEGEWLYNVHVYPKNKIDDNAPVKTVADPGHGITLGDEITWTIEKTLPELAEGDTFSSLVFTDDLDPRTGGEDNTTVEVPGIDSGDYTVTIDGQKVTVAFTETGLAKLEAGQTVTVKITTTVNELGDSAEFENTALVNVNGAEQTTEPAKVFYGQIQVNKFEAGAGDNTLAGAEFELYAADSDGKPTGQALASGTTNADGTFDTPLSVWVGTQATDTRTYVLVETKAPAGYVTPTGNAANHEVVVSVGENSTVSITVADVANTKHEGPSLPLTGSTGTLIFMILGLALIATGGTVAAVRHHRTKA